MKRPRPTRIPSRRRLVPSTLSILLAAWAIPGAAQQPADCGGGDVAAADRAPDIIIRARVEAEELRFATDPEVSVQLTGCAELDSVRVTERTNLPDPIEPGTTYRNVAIGVEISGFLDVRCLLPGLAEAIAIDSISGGPGAIGPGRPCGVDGPDARP